MDFNFSFSLILCILFPLSLLIFTKLKTKPQNPSSTKLPKDYPFIGSFFTILKNKDTFVQWSSQIVTSTPTLTFPLHRGLGSRVIVTANAANVEHILKSKFQNYEKGDFFKVAMKDFLGDGIFNSDGQTWKFQRQVASHEFNMKSLRKFVETVVDSELSGRLIPILRKAAEEKTVVDFQDILQRFAFDNICKIAFGYDPGYLSLEDALQSYERPEKSEDQPNDKFAVAFDRATMLSNERLNSFNPLIWKIKKALNIGSEKHLKIAIKQIRDFATQIVKEKKQELEHKSSLESVDLLSRFLSSGHSDENFVIDIVISFILAGRDTTSAALTWFFWLLSDHPEVEREIVREINGRSEASSAYDEVREMVYTHASICESMRLYPPVPLDSKEALSDDVLPDGTVVKKGMRVFYHPYAMGRVERVWGGDWPEFKPVRWLAAADGGGGKWSFVHKDSFTYPVFQAGPRICLGKEMAFLQMKRVVAAVLERFRVVPVEGEASPEYVTNLTAKMKGGFPVRIEVRI